MEAASVVKAVIMAANQYCNHKVDTNSVYFQRQLEVLIGITSRSSGTSLKFFNPKNLQPTECLTAVIDILCDAQTRPGLILKCVTLLQNLAVDNEIRESLHDAFHLTPALASVIRMHGTSSGEALTVESLNLLQKVTYGHKINFQENYVEDLLGFVVKHIHGPVNELTQPCLGLLVNLCRDNFSVQSHIKNLDNAKALYKTLMSYLSDQNLTIIIFSLSVITSLCLHEDLGEKLFNARNINQTFQTIFNILMKGDSGVTRRYAVDLFTDLLKNSKIQQSLARFDRLSSCLENILNLIASSTAESVVKIFELLLSFCGVEGTRAVICKCLLGTSSLQDRDHFVKALQQPVSQVKEPLFATVHWASQTTDSYDQAPLYALDFLSEFYEELIYSNVKVQYSAHADLVLPMVLLTLQTKVDGQNPMQTKKCLKIVKALQLLIVLCGEEDIMRKVCKCMDMTLFSGLLEYQFSNNRIALRSGKDLLPSNDWSDSGVDAVLCSLELMEKLRKSLPDIDALFTRTLQDSRIVAFLTAGLASQNRSRVQTSLQLITVGTTFEGFPTVLLGDAVAANNNRIQDMKHSTSCYHGYKPEESHMWSGILSNKENMLSLANANTNNRMQSVPTMDQNASINSLIEKMQTGLEMKDIKSSEIIDIYEHKLQSLQTKEEQLQDLLEAKTLALSQADRLIAQCRSRRAQYEAEAHKMRSLLQESERRSEEFREQLNDITLRKENLQNELDNLCQENQKLEQVAEEHQQLTGAYSELSERYESSEKTLLSLKQEHKTLSEMHEMLQKHNESLKHQHDVASEQLSKLQEERKQLSKQLKEKEAKLSEITKAHQKLEKEYSKVGKERDGLEDAIDKLRVNLEKTEQSKKQLQHQVSSLELVCQQHEVDIKEKEEQIHDLKSNVEKHAQIAALIHSLSSGKSDASSVINS